MGLFVFFKSIVTFKFSNSFSLSWRLILKSTLFHFNAFTLYLHLYVHDYFSSPCDLSLFKLIIFFSSGPAPPSKSSSACRSNQCPSARLYIYFCYDGLAPQWLFWPGLDSNPLSFGSLCRHLSPLRHRLHSLKVKIVVCLSCSYT